MEVTMGDANLSFIGIVIGLILIVIPEPATTATGLALTTASTGVSVSNGDIPGGGT